MDEETEFQRRRPQGGRDIFGRTPEHETARNNDSNFVYPASISPFPVAHPLLHHHMQSWWEWVSRCPSFITVAEGLQSSNLRGLKEMAGVLSLLRLAPYLTFSTCLANVTSVSPWFYLLSVW